MEDARSNNPQSYRIVVDFTDRRNFAESIVTGLRAGRPMKCSSIIGRRNKRFLINLYTDFVVHIGSLIHLLLGTFSIGGKAVRV